MDERSLQGDPRSFTALTLPYLPRPVWRSFHDSQARFRVAVAHRRAGKTVALVNELIRAALFCERNDPRFAYIAPFLGQAKAIAWDYLKAYTRAIPGARVNEGELRVDLPRGGRVRLFGADNPDALRGLYFDGIVLDEFGDIDPRVYVDVLRPTLSDRTGWAVFAGTPRGKNAFYDYRELARLKEKDWALWELKASETGILTEEELASARASMDEDAYMREYECSFDAAVAGAYYVHEMAEAAKAGRICRLPVEPTIPVDTAWDLGIDDATAIWFVQDVGKERRLVDYFETSGEGLPAIVKALEKRGYRYGRHVLPHDVEAREMGTGKSRRETLEKLGVRRIEVVPADDVADTLHDSATGAMALMAAAQKRVRLIARIFAESGIKDLFLGVHALIRENCSAQRFVRLNGAWTAIDPSNWAERNEMTIEVGLGAAGRTHDLQMGTQASQILQQIVAGQGGAQGPIVRPENVYAMARYIFGKLGIKAPERFLTDPSDPNAPQPPAPSPPPELLKVQLEHQRESQKNAADVANRAREIDTNAQLKRAEIEGNLALKRYDIDARAKVDLANALARTSSPAPMPPVRT